MGGRAKDRRVLVNGAALQIVFKEREPWLSVIVYSRRVEL
jgi:hypothetical protein